MVNTLTAYQAERAFDDFLLGQEQFGFRVLPSIREIQTQLRLEAEFRDRLYQSIAIVSVLAMGAALVLGISIARVITRPLRALKTGIQALRENKSSKIELTGNEEVDEVIEEFNELSDELEFQEILRSNLIADISHEFKTPLTSLTGQIHGIRDGLFKPDKDRFDLITNQIDRLTELVNSLQNYTHMQSELRNLQKKSCNLKKFLEKELKIYEEELKKNSIQLDMQIDNSLHLNADKQKIGQVIDNIVTNTIKYAEASKITIKADVQKGIITIGDNGKGVLKKDLDLLFERFYRVEKSRNRKTGGLGLGLAIVKDIINAHDWTIIAHSGEKRGITYEFRVNEDLFKIDKEEVQKNQPSGVKRIFTRISSKKQ